MENTYQPSKDRYTDMKYRRAGRSGVLLSSIALGLWHNFGANDNQINARDMLYYAFDNGITYFDLANNYGPPNGSAEETFGKIYSNAFLSYRSELFIATKAGHEMWEGPYGSWGSRKSLMNSLDQSLSRMNLDYVDLFYSHRYDPETPLEETMQTLVDMVKQGKALYIGISKYPPEAALFAYDYLHSRDVPCLVYQGKYNLLHREPEYNTILEDAQRVGVGFVAFSPLAQGLLTDKYLNGKFEKESRMALNHFLRSDILTDELLSKLRKLNNIARQREQTLSEMALTWLLRSTTVSSVIVGASSTQQIKQNLKALDKVQFTDQELASIQRILDK